MTIGQTRRDRLRFVFLAADPFPPVRPDVMTLFGRELIRLDHQITWILTSKNPAEPRLELLWPCGPLYLGGRRSGTSFVTNLYNRWRDLLNDLKLIKILRTGSFDFVQLKDKFLAVIPTILIAKWYKTPFSIGSHFLTRKRPSILPMRATDRRGTTSWYDTGYST